MCVCSVMSDSLKPPLDCSQPGSSVHEIFQAIILEQVAISSSRDLPNPGIKPVSLSSPALAGGFFTTSATWETPWSKYVSAEVSSFVLQILLASDEPVDSSHTNAF